DVHPAPVRNAHGGMTIAQLLDLHTAGEGGLTGRVMSEALPNGIIPKAADGKIVSKPASNGLQTIVKFQHVLSQRYFDAAGFAGRTAGIDAESGKQKTAGKKTPRPLADLARAEFTSRCRTRSAVVPTAA